MGGIQSGAFRKSSHFPLHLFTSMLSLSSLLESFSHSFSNFKIVFLETIYKRSQNSRKKIILLKSAPLWQHWGPLQRRADFVYSLCFFVSEKYGYVPQGHNWFIYFFYAPEQHNSSGQNQHSQPSRFAGATYTTNSTLHNFRVIVITSFQNFLSNISSIRLSPQRFYKVF